MRKWGVPASVTISQAILESSNKLGWGQSELAREANNYFGIKAVHNASPESYIELPTHEVLHNHIQLIDAEFARYPDLAGSFDAHARLLATAQRYKPAMAATHNAVAFALQLPGKTWLVPVLVLLAVSAMLGATQDIGSDGVYVTTLPPRDMAKYTGFQSMCWNAGFLLAAGPLIHFSGVLHESTHSWGTSWMVILLVIAGVMVLAGLYHSRLLPPGARNSCMQMARRWCSRSRTNVCGPTPCRRTAVANSMYW